MIVKSRCHSICVTVALMFPRLPCPGLVLSHFRAITLMWPRQSSQLLWGNINKVRNVPPCSHPLCQLGPPRVKDPVRGQLLHYFVCIGGWCHQLLGDVGRRGYFPDLGPRQTPGTHPPGFWSQPLSVSSLSWTAAYFLFIWRVTSTGIWAVKKLLVRNLWPAVSLLPHFSGDVKPHLLIYLLIDLPARTYNIATMRDVFI